MNNTATQNSHIALSMQGISKKYFGSLAVNNVDFEVASGEVHALLGENGAGKSTLMKILAGSFDDYKGEIFIKSQPVTLHSPLEALNHGIGMVYQELSLARPLSIAENLFVGRLPHRNILIDYQKLKTDTQDCLNRVGLDLDPLLPIEAISQHEAQRIEIAKVLWHQPQILVMDEPTSSLSRDEVDLLFEIIKRLVNEGLAIVYISHHLPEIFKIADRATVLRDGKKVETLNISDVNTAQLAEMMVGRKIVESKVSKKNITKESLLEVSNLTRFGFFHNVSFNINNGELLGLAGLTGAGRTEMARCLVGIDPIDKGKITLKGKKFHPRNMHHAQQNGIVYLTEDRKTEGLALRLTCRENLLAMLIDIHSRFGVYRRKPGKGIINNLIEKLNIQPPDPEYLVGSLSGGNQQKVLLAKCLATKPRLLILDEPTRGVDIGAKILIHEVVLDLAKNGISVLIISSDLPELIKLSNRILIMRKGFINKELPQDKFNEESLLFAVNEDVIPVSNNLN